MKKKYVWATLEKPDYLYVNSLYIYSNEFHALQRGSADVVGMYCVRLCLIGVKKRQGEQRRRRQLAYLSQAVPAVLHDPQHVVRALAFAVELDVTC